MSGTARKRCTIYTRKSSEEGLEQDFNSLAAQREACEAYIVSQRSEGWIALPELYDYGGFSGANLDRPAMQRLLEVIDTGDVDIVVVYKVDRLTRSLADFAKLVDQFDAHSVSVVAVTQPFNTTTSMGRLTLNVLLSFAQFEREITGERIRDKIAASKAKGMWMGGCVPLGYDAVDRQLIVNEAEAEKVRHIYQRYLALGSVYKLMQQLDRDNIRSKARISTNGTPRGNARFSRGALYPLLRNRIYIGEIVHHGESYPGNHDAIVDQELFDAIQQKLKENSHSHIRRATSPSLLAGKLYDGQGNRLYPCHANKKGKRYRYYVSKAVMDGGQSKTRARWPAQSLESFIRQRLAEHLADPKKWIPGETSQPIDLYDKAIEVGQRVLVSPAGDELLRDLIRSAVLADASITITIDRKALRNHLPIPDGLKLHERWTASLTVRSRHNGERRILTPDDTDEPDPVLLKALTDAHQWHEQLSSTNYPSIAALARAIGRSSRDVKRILNLVYLTPRLKEAIINGTQPDDMTLQALTKTEPITPEFETQYLRWGIESDSGTR